VKTLAGIVIGVSLALGMGPMFAAPPKAGDAIEDLREDLQFMLEMQEISLDRIADLESESQKQWSAIIDLETRMKAIDRKL
jgi:hypothetical protein